MSRIDVVGDGSYWLDPETLDLYSAESGGRWDVDLLKCRTTAQVLDWVFHASDGGADRRTASLVRCLDALLNPRDGLCSGAIAGRRPGEFSEKEIRRRVAAFVARRTRAL